MLLNVQRNAQHLPFEKSTLQGRKIKTQKTFSLYNNLETRYECNTHHTLSKALAVCQSKRSHLLSLITGQNASFDFQSSFKKRINAVHAIEKYPEISRWFEDLNSKGLHANHDPKACSIKGLLPNSHTGSKEKANHIIWQKYCNIGSWLLPKLHQWMKEGSVLGAIWST